MTIERHEPTDIQRQTDGNDLAAKTCQTWRQEFQDTQNPAERKELQIKYNNLFCSVRTGEPISYDLPNLKIPN